MKLARRLWSRKYTLQHSWSHYRIQKSCSEHSLLFWLYFNLDYLCFWFACLHVYCLAVILSLVLPKRNKSRANTDIPKATLPESPSEVKWDDSWGNVKEIEATCNIIRVGGRRITENTNVQLWTHILLCCQPKQCQQVNHCLKNNNNKNWPKE